jgi:pilus assembly protein FimV
VHDVILESWSCSKGFTTSEGGIVNKKYTLFGKRHVVALAAISGLALAPAWVNAAGMGGITVYSMLGQPLRAEVKVMASPEELSGMVAHLAPREVFTQTGVDYASALSGLRFSLDTTGGSAVVRITSEQPVNDPYLDFLVELSWPAGRLTRGYTVLLDPPEVATQALYRQATVVATTPSVQKSKAASAAVGSEAAAGEAAAGDATAGGIAGEHVVKAGETLGRIARNNLPAGVTIEQMLVALYQNNPDAFMGDNMNRLRRGAVLKIPAAADVANISVSDAKQVFRTQSVSWRNYRNKLAAAAGDSVVSENGRSITDQVRVKVEEPLSTAESGDKVRVSRNNQSTGKAGVLEEDLIASERELKDSMDKLKELEQIVANLRELVTRKDESIRKSQKELDSLPPPTVKPATQPDKSSQAVDVGFKISLMAAYRVAA